MKETKNKILQSAITIWGNDMMATLDDIAGNIGISRRTLHRHYTGREDLLKSVFNFIIDEYLLRLKEIMHETSDNKTRLKQFFLNDVESGSRYMVFCQLRKSKYKEFETEDDNFMEVYSIYTNLFQNLKDEKQIRPELSMYWLETIYMLMVEASLTSMDQGIEKSVCLDMAWSTFWNGIKFEN